MRAYEIINEYRIKYDDKGRPTQWYDTADIDTEYWDDKTGNSYHVLRLNDNIWGYVIGNGWNKVFWGKHQGNLKIKDHPSITGAGQIYHDLLSKGFKRVDLSKGLKPYQYIIDQVNASL